jgi:pimeloyl-ACP methyl ester carboxylesterase
MSRIFPSRITEGPGEGKDYDDSPELYGQLQPYSIYVPSTYHDRKPVGLVLDLHSLGEHHWQYNGSTGVQQLGEERDAIVISCECRGEDGWYQHEAELDVFEMWNDAARHYTLDPDRVAITGYSMGGYATYRLATLYPDLFRKALSIVGPPTGGIWAPPTSVGTNASLTNLWLENARNVPFLNAVAVPDELVPYAGTRAQNMGAPGITGFDQLGYRFRFLSYPTAEHLTIAVLGYDLPYQVEWLGDAAVDRNPTHVTFSYLPEADSPDYGLVHDHAYWVSGIVLADASAGFAKGTVDAFTHAHGRGDPASEAGSTAGHGPLPYVEEFRTWGEAPTIPAENALTVTLTNVREVTLDGTRAGLDPSQPVTLTVTTDAPAVIHVVVGSTVHRIDLANGTSTVTL